MGLDQLVFNPALLVIFLIYNTKHKEGNFWSIYRNTLFTGYTVWPLFQLVNFFFIPLNLRIYAVNMAAFLWNVYISRIMHSNNNNSTELSIQL